MISYEDDNNDYENGNFYIGDIYDVDVIVSAMSYIAPLTLHSH